MYLVGEKKKPIAEGDWHPVRSSIIAGIRYNKKRKELSVMFDRSTVYVYRQVPEVLFNKMLTAKSKGQFYNTHLKGIYDSARAQ